jgi:hypothetical protein
VGIQAQAGPSLAVANLARKRKMQHIEIRVKGQITPQWSEWFDGLTISHPDPDETVLTGIIPDQAALYGIISRLRDLGLSMCSLCSDIIKENGDGV